MDWNELLVDRADFCRAMRIFRDYTNHKRCPDAMLAFEGRFLSFEVGEDIAVIGASGIWNGRAFFKAYVLAALHHAPPNGDTITLRCNGERVQIAGLSVACRWESASAPFVAQATEPSLIDLLAMGRTANRSEIRGSELGKKVLEAKRSAGGIVKRAARSLARLGIDEAELWALVEMRIQQRIDNQLPGILTSAECRDTTDKSTWPVISCNGCATRLRVPPNKDLIVRCPKCGASFEISS
jgi:hypothetical protein